MSQASVVVKAIVDKQPAAGNRIFQIADKHSEATNDAHMNR